ncbi:glycosyltransferase [Flavobacterium degerlachei]|jgi:glycosyltransferase involved in cell wall biosynthesis|uniref:Glycosyltransferase involved in cell wall bisynthesis n=1 Tax=Flavobacterium degerlachei TaxID=229203 RepID=A0A1H2X878_9FLAO|nr:glycosyltransferase [Flavobacterium degerlachei]SDW89122.1 Glycosyltransferase involved in cell wall bisynthesis [Flavobacterium degerlachei]
MIKNRNKVAIISTSLGRGGAEKFASMLSYILDNCDVEIHNIIVNDDINYKYAGELLNLGSHSLGYNSVFKKIKKGFLLHQYLKEKEIDLIIDNRPRNNLTRELLTHWIYGKRRLWFVVHSSKLDNYFPKSIFWSKFLYQKTEKIICVSKAIELELKQKFDFENTTTIYNPYDLSKTEIKNDEVFDGKYILYFGRFDEKVKNFSLMLEAFSISKIFMKGYKLYLMGEGPDLTFIQDKIKELKLDSFVETLPFNNNPFPYVQQAKFTILTSRHEGFPLSIVESLALGIPVISVDCKSGPNEIIKNEYNGLLVENNNPNSLASAMNRFIDDSDLYDFCKKNASSSVQHLSLKSISKQWESILF